MRHENSMRDFSFFVTFPSSCRPAPFFPRFFLFFFPSVNAATVRTHDSFFVLVGKGAADQSRRVLPFAMPRPRRKGARQHSLLLPTTHQPEQANEPRWLLHRDELARRTLWRTAQQPANNPQAEQQCVPVQPRGQPLRERARPRRLRGGGNNASAATTLLCPL